MCKKDADTCNINSKPTSAFGVFFGLKSGKRDRIRRDKVVPGIYV